MSDLRSQLHDYVESTIERVDVEDVVAAISAGRIDDPRPARRLRPIWVAAGAAVLVLLAIAVPLMFFRTGNSITVVDQPTTTAVSTTTVPPTTPTTTQPISTTALIPEMVQAQPGVPLSEAVPGFTDTIVMFATPISHYVYRWDPSEPTPEVILTAGGGPVGLDVSGSWLAEIYGDGDLMVYPVPAMAEDSSQPEVVASEVASALWHDTDPGRLAVLACPQPSSETATLFTLDITSVGAEPVPIRSFDQGCEVGDTFLEGWKVGDVWLDQWNSVGVTVGVFNGDTFEPILIGADGSEIPIDSGIAVLPEGPDGQGFDVEAAIGDDEELRDASWSPDGTLIALSVWVPSSDDPNRTVRLVDAVSGEAVVEIPERGSGKVVTAIEWSSDGRFLLYSSWDNPAEWSDVGNDIAALGIYDTATNTTTMIPLPGVIDEIRIP